MSILQGTAPEVTKQQLLVKKCNFIRDFAAASFGNLQGTYNNAVSLLWQDENFTAQELFDELGDDGVKLYQLHTALGQFVETLAQSEGIPSGLVTLPNEITFDNNKIILS